MAGHSKFKNIQFRKDRQDAARSKLFSKFSRDITIAARGGVPDPAANARLRMGDAGSVAFMFERLGRIAYPRAAGSDEAVLEAAIEAGAADVESDDGGHVI